MKPNTFLMVAGGFLCMAMVASAANRYVDLNNPAPLAPYTSWTTAATNIQDAVDAAVAGDEIVVTNGYYATGGRAVYGTMTNRVAIDKAVTVRSVNGPLVTLIEGRAAFGSDSVNGNGDGAIRCVYVGTNAVLGGFTLTNGHTREVGDKKERDGGGAWCEVLSVLTNCILIGNSASLAGGGANNGTLNNCTLTGNSAVSGGGAYDSSLNNCTLTGNSAFFDGGAAAGGMLNHCIVSGNSASLAGGGANDGTLNHCTLAGNSALSGGGAYDSRLNNCTLTGNSAFFDGGAAAGGMLTNCTLISNSANAGGGAYNSTLNNCTLNSNSAIDGGGAFSGTLNNCTLTGNSAQSGGGAFSATLNNCTLTGNCAQSGGGALGGRLSNCIVYYNSAANGPNYSGSSLNYCCTTPLPPGPGNLDAEPLLASTSHLSAESPCVGRGSSAYSSGVDIDGEDWLNPPCIGADQWTGGQATGALALAIAAAYTNVSPGFSVSFMGLNEGRINASVWDFGDAVVVSNRAYASHSWATPGLYAVRLTGYNDSMPDGVSATVLVRVTAREVYYVDQANATPAYPYMTWTGAATNIQNAIDAGTQIGRLVLVADGVYKTGGRAVYGTMTNRVVVFEGVEVRSVNGPLVTLIEGRAVPGSTNGDGAIRCAYVGTNALLSGFTLTNGHTRSTNNNEGFGGGAWCEVSAVLTNCILKGNSAANGGGASRGTLKNCTLSANWAVQQGGGAYAAVLNNCILSSNASSFYGGGAYSGTLNNCLLSDNSARHYGGGADSGTLNNCTLTRNSANSYGGGAYDGILNNCIVYYNSAPAYPNYGSSFLKYCCSTPLPPGPGNLDNAPAFADTNGWSNLRLQANSPCINAGKNAYGPNPTDLDGNPRTMGGTVDMGAYEFQSPASAISYAWLQQYGLPTDGLADSADSDTDGFQNWQEWIAGTDPTNSASALRMLMLLPGAETVDGITASWSSVTNRTYSLERASDLGVPPSFNLVRTNIAGLNNRTAFTDTNATGPGRFFYRVRVEN